MPTYKLPLFRNVWAILAGRPSINDSRGLQQNSNRGLLDESPSMTTEINHITYRQNTVDTTDQQVSHHHHYHQ